MKALWLLKAGPIEAVLSLREETDDPEPARDEIRLRVRAAGLNFADILIRQGLYPGAPPLPAVLGFDAAGVIDAVGEGVDPRRLGRRAAARMSCGAHAESVCVPASSVFDLPDDIDFCEAAALPVTFVTAYRALFTSAHLEAGDRVLVHAAAGGVGLAAVQLAAAIEGVEVIGTASAGKHRIILEHGCSHAIDYRCCDYVREVLRITGGRGVDVVLDPLGGEDTRKGYGLLRSGGRLVCYGFSNLVHGQRRDHGHIAEQVRAAATLTSRELIADNRSVSGLDLFRLQREKPGFRGGDMEALLRLHAEGVIRPFVAEQFPLTDAAEAYRRMQARDNIGKMVFVF